MFSGGIDWSDISELISQRSLTTKFHKIYDVSLESKDNIYTCYVLDLSSMPTETKLRKGHH